MFTFRLSTWANSHFFTWIVALIVNYYQVFTFILTFTFFILYLPSVICFSLRFKIFYLYVCARKCGMCVCVHVCTHTCTRACGHVWIWKPGCLSQCPSASWDRGQGLSVNLESTCLIDWLTTKSPGLSGQPLPRAGIMGKCHRTRFFSWVLEIWTLNLTLACLVFYQPSHLPSILLCSPGWPGVLDPPTPAFPPNARMISGIRHTQFSFSFSQCETNTAS